MTWRRNSSTYAISGSSCGASSALFDVDAVGVLEAAVLLVIGGKSSTTAPANQSRLSLDDEPAHWLSTARVRAGQRFRERATACSKLDTMRDLLVV
jgi:hypothetical protein